jgi:aconitate hydratase
MATAQPNPFGARGTLTLGSETATIFRLPELERKGVTRLDRLPFSIRILLENALRFAGRGLVTDDHVTALGKWSGGGRGQGEIPWMPARVVLQDFTGVPCVVDLAAMRDAMARMKGDPDRINPMVPCDLVIDHSVQVDFSGTASAYQQNVDLEYQRNRRPSGTSASCRRAPASCTR